MRDPEGNEAGDGIIAFRRTVRTRSVVVILRRSVVVLRIVVIQSALRIQIPGLRIPLSPSLQQNMQTLHGNTLRTSPKPGFSFILDI